MHYVEVKLKVNPRKDNNIILTLLKKNVSDNCLNIFAKNIVGSL